MPSFPPPKARAFWWSLPREDAARRSATSGDPAPAASLLTKGPSYADFLAGFVTPHSRQSAVGTLCFRETPLRPADSRTPRRPSPATYRSRLTYRATCRCLRGSRMSRSVGARDCFRRGRVRRVARASGWGAGSTTSSGRTPPSSAAEECWCCPRAVSPQCSRLPPRCRRAACPQRSAAGGTRSCWLGMGRRGRVSGLGGAICPSCCLGGSVPCRGRRTCACRRTCSPRPAPGSPTRSPSRPQCGSADPSTLPWRPGYR
mmetsp:Transcript_15360/g.35678  ORF Transcript_15360/g.35678 Transcript_15360/m.35678 type:complete len:259 (-) Transcript_15360:1070-1846(-)